MDVESRLSRLELENRRLKVGGVLALIVVVSLALMGQVSPGVTTFDRIQARRIIIMNERGTPLITLSGGCTIEDSPNCGGIITFTGTPSFAEDELAFLRLQTVRGFPEIHMRGEAGPQQLVMDARPQETPKVELRAADGPSIRLVP
jgi:hypothetical protein